MPLGEPTRPIRAWRFDIAEDQILAQMRAVDARLLLLRSELATRPSSPQDHEHLRQLQIQLAQTQEALRQLRIRPRRKPKLLDRLLVRLWKWATDGRFDVDLESLRAGQ